MAFDVAPARMLLNRDTRSAKAAREFLTASCADHQGAAVLTNAQLLISELVTNAVQHGGGPIEVEVWCTPGQGVKVWVRDAGAGMPHERAPGVDDEHGRGLALVRALSDEWGISACPGGKSVWFYLRE